MRLRVSAPRWRPGQEPDPLDHLEEVASAWLEQAARHGRAGRWERALRAAHVGARVMATQNRRLAWPALEQWLQEAGAALEPAGPSCPRPAEAPPAAAATSACAPACLHVLTEALEAGGHSAMARRWMQLDTVHPVQHAALLSLHDPAPAWLEQAVRARGGEVFQAPAGSGLLERARWLRALARQHAQRVVLHVDVADVVAAAAFSRPGGPPVMLVNHAAHLCASGVRSADLVLDCRGSWLEQTWSAVHRGARRRATVPIPLEATERLGAAGAADAARQWLGLAPDLLVTLTLGAHFKFRAVPGLDFLATWERILGAHPQAALVAAGFAPDVRWRAAAARWPGRIVLPGVVPGSEVARLHAAADLYAEGFAFGTTTALLEAGLAGLPAVLPPRPCGPPLATDGLAVDGLLRAPADEPAYERQVLTLLRDPASRRALGARLQRSIATHHTGAGWQRHLREALAQLPDRHAPLPTRPPVPTPAAQHRRWLAHAQAWTSGPGASLDRSLLHALTLGLGNDLGLLLTPALRDSCRRHARLRRGQAIPLALLRGLAWTGSGWATLAHHQPEAAAAVVRLLSFLARQGLARRCVQRAARALGRAEGPRGAYDDYRPGPPGTPWRIRSPWPPPFPHPASRS